jgi:hypothetical protein
MTEMSPVSGIIMRVLKYGVWVAGGLLLLFGSISVWQTRQADGSFLMTAQEWKFLGLLAILFLIAVYLLRSIGKEIEDPGA